MVIPTELDSGQMCVEELKKRVDDDDDEANMSESSSSNINEKTMLVNIDVNKQEPSKRKDTLKGSESDEDYEESSSRSSSSFDENTINSNEIDHQKEAVDDGCFYSRSSSAALSSASSTITTSGASSSDPVISSRLECQRVKTEGEDLTGEKDASSGFVYINKIELQRLENSIERLQSQQNEQAKLIEHIQAQLNNCIRIQNKLKSLGLAGSSQKRSLDNSRIEHLSTYKANEAVEISNRELDENEQRQSVGHRRNVIMDNDNEEDDEEVYSVAESDDADDVLIGVEEDPDVEYDGSNSKRRKLSTTLRIKNDSSDGNDTEMEKSDPKDNQQNGLFYNFVSISEFYNFYI